MHYRRMYDDTDMLYHYDLEGAKGDVIVQIERVSGGELTGQKGRKSKKPFVKFVGKDKKLALNKTNGKTIARLFGPDTDNWTGKFIALFVTTTEMDGETVECIRVRPRIPDAKPSGGRGNENRRAAAAAASSSGGEHLHGAIRAQMERDGAAPPDEQDSGSAEQDNPGASQG